jgi:hypothetical protein
MVFKLTINGKDHDMAAIDAAIGHPDATVLRQIGAAPTYRDLERIVRSEAAATRGVK